MLSSVCSPLKRLVSVFLLYSIGLLLCLPFAPVSAAISNPKQVAGSASQQTQTPAHRTNEVLVRFRPGVSQANRDFVAASHGTRLKKRLRGESALEKLELTGAGDAINASLHLNLNPAVEFAEPNFLVKSDQLSTIPNDPRFSEQWTLSNTGQNGGQYGSP